MKILLIEDEQQLAEDICAYLEPENVVCTHVSGVEEAEESIQLYDYDVVILDVGLPDGSGLRLLPLLLEKDPPPGILIISAKNSLDDKLAGLDLGADDYITKPFHLAELHSRIRSVYRRKHLGGKKSLKTGDLEIFPDDFRLQVNGKDITLTPKEFQLLLYFTANAGRVLSKSAIAEHLWGDQADTMDDFDFIYSHVKNLRKKIIGAGGADRIKAVYGIGYKFENE